MTEDEFELDFETSEEEILSTPISLTRLRPGDLILAQPKNYLDERAIESLYSQCKTMMPEGVHLLIVPPTWKMSIARPSGDDAIIAGLQDIVEDLS